MIKLNTLQRQREEILKNYNPYDEKDVNRKKKVELSFIDKCIKYLETNPREGFVKKELKRIEDEVEFIIDRFDDWTSTEKKALEGDIFGAYKRELGVPKRIKHIKVLEFLLKDNAFEKTVN